MPRYLSSAGLGAPVNRHLRGFPSSDSDSSHDTTRYAPRITPPATPNARSTLSRLDSAITHVPRVTS